MSYIGQTLPADTFQGAMLMDMDANDTATLNWSQSGGSAQADVFDSTYFSGFLAC